MGGVVLNLSSVLAFAPEPRFIAPHAYAAAKAAVIGLTRSAAAHYAAANIRFSAIAPGLVDTPMSHRAMNDDTIRAFVETRQPLDGGRVGQAEDLDAAVVYLLSDAARFVTGQLIAIDGGWSLGAGARLI
jgi:NAD(P)-dependent dehydrogenase (short-subunit alcohol dehydrogenase family)